MLQTEVSAEIPPSPVSKHNRKIVGYLVMNCGPRGQVLMPLAEPKLKVGHQGVAALLLNYCLQCWCLILKEGQWPRNPFRRH